MSASTGHTEHRYTIEEYARLPEDWRVDLVRGLLVREPEPGYLHGEIQGALVERLRPYLREHAPELNCIAAVSHILAQSPPTVRGPDVAVIRRAVLPRPDHVGFIPGAPEIAVEIHSPGDRAGDMRRKVADYFGAGTRLVWIIHPTKRTIVVHEPDRSRRTLGVEDTLDGGAVLPKFSMPVAELFAD